jgi:hypothetical protein
LAGKQVSAVKGNETMLVMMIEERTRERERDRERVKLNLI